MLNRFTWELSTDIIASNNNYTTTTITISFGLQFLWHTHTVVS